MPTFRQNQREKGLYRTLSAEEFARDVEGFTSHNDNLLAIEQLLGHGAGQATKEMPLAVDDDLYPSKDSSQFSKSLSKKRKS